MLKKYLIVFLLLMIVNFLGFTQNISGIINTYHRVTSYNFCLNSVTVDSCANLNVGDKVLIIQMRGALIDSTNTPTSGSINDIQNAGNYDIAVIDSMYNCTLFFKDSLKNMYNSYGFMQVIKIPQYNNVTVSDTLTCKPWDGIKGGVLIFEASGTVTLNAPIIVTGNGFRGGIPFNCEATFSNSVPWYAVNSSFGHVKGEGIATLPTTLLGGRGTVGNGGGAAGSVTGAGGHTDAYLNGGGGGGNYGKGGIGGRSSNYNTSFYHGGLGGKSLDIYYANNKIFMGGGGGCGHRRFVSNGSSHGRNGGGIVIIKANTIIGNDNEILANGIGDNTTLSLVGRGGSGAGGTILLNVQNFNGNLIVSAKGGNGGNCSGTYTCGPGGGGGGGLIWLSTPTVPSNISYNVIGGLNGLYTNTNSSQDAMPGDTGAILTGLQLNENINATFVPAAQTTNITGNSPLCVGDTLILTTGPVPPSVQFLWEGPNGFTSNMQNPVINGVTSLDSGTFTLELIMQGCPGPKAYYNVYVGVHPPPPLTNNDTVCFGYPNPTLNAIGSNIRWYADTNLTTLLSTGNSFIPPNTAIGTYNYYLTQNDSLCSSPYATSSLTILPAPLAPNVSDQIVCFGTPSAPFNVTASGIVNWYTDSTLLNLIHTGTSFSSPSTNSGTYNYYVNIYDTAYQCTSHYTNFKLIIVPTAFAVTSNDTSMCKGDTAYLSVNASIFSSYLWSTGDTTQFISVLPNLQESVYSVTVNNGCGIAVDSVKITIIPLPPATTNDTVCFGYPNPALTATGTNISWYADAMLTTLLGTGSSYMPTFASVGTHTLYATQTSGTCESFPNPAYLEIIPTPLPPAINNQTVCIGDSVYPFIASATGLISWYTDSALNNLIKTGDTLISNETNAGIYYYYATVLDTSNMCLSNVKEVILMIVPPPYAIASNDTTVCSGTPADLFVEASINSQFLWSNGDTSQLITVNPTSDTKYFVTVDNGCFGVAIDSVTVSVFPLTQANAGSDTSVCIGSLASLTASGGISYQWSHNLGNLPSISVSPNTTTTYTVTVTDANTCSDIDSVVVNVMPLPIVTIYGDTFICEGNSTILTANGGINYLWNNNSTTASINVSPVVNTTYTVSVTDNNNCTNTSSFNVDVHNTFYITLNSNFAPLHTINEGQLVIFTATPNIYSLYNFYINTILKQSSAINTFQTASLENNDYVSVVAYDMGCPSVVDSIKITVQQLPNAFTPFEEDGINEIFGKGLELTILNRWGQELYKGTEGWDGRYKNNKVSPGTYFYVIELNKGTVNAKLLTGTINVVAK